MAIWGCHPKADNNENFQICFKYVCFEIALSSKQPLCCFAKTEMKSDFKCVFYCYNVY